MRAVSLVLEKDLFDGQIYNALTENFTVENIVGQIKEFVPTLKVDYVDSAIMNQLSYEVDDGKFRKLGYQPQGKLRQGVKESIDLLRGILVS